MAKSSVVPWHGVREAPIVLITGSEHYLADRAATELRNRLRSVTPELEVNEFDAGEYLSGTIAEYASPSLFGEPRLLKIWNGESGTDDFVSDVIDYLSLAQEDVVLIIRHAGGLRGKKMLEALRASESVLEVECAEISKEADRISFVSGEFKRLGVGANREAVQALVEAFTDDLAELAAAVNQIASDAEGKEITGEFVDSYYGGREEVTAFAVVDSALEGDRAEALRLLRHAVLSGVDPVPIVAAFAMKLRQLAKVGGYSGPPAEAQKTLGMQSWMIDRARRTLRGWNGESLGRAIIATAEADSQVKGKGRDPVFVVERMVDRIASRT